MIEIRNLVRRYGEKTAVDQLNLQIPPGVFYTFLGPNGAGKTTTMKIMAGLLKPSDGEVRIDGIDITANPTEAKKKIGYIPDHPYLYDKITGWEFLQFTGGLHGLEPEKLSSRAEELLEYYSLSDDAHQLIGSYSHGMRQRLAFCSCFLHDPRVAIIDEPWVGLDPRNIRSAIEFLRRRCETGVTIFMSTHSLDIAEDIAERMGILHQGKLLYDGTLEELRSTADSSNLEEIFLKMTD
jgi:ABC-2 type transport system ATP-binding protein